EATAKQTAEFRENLVSALPDQQRSTAYVSALVTDYQRKFNSAALNERLIAIYDQHFTEDEIKGLLQFYSSPLGRRFAAEIPKIPEETEPATRAEGTQTATEIVQQLPPWTAEPPLAQGTAKPVQAARKSSKGQPTQPEAMASASQP